MSNLSLSDWLVSGGIVALLVELVRGFYQRRKMGGDYASQMAAAANTLVGPLAKRVAELEEKLGRAEVREHELVRQLRMAENQVQTLRGDLRSARTEARELRRMLEATHDKETDR